MVPKMENPALVARGVPEVHLAAGKIDPELINTRRLTQAAAKQLACEVFSTPPVGTIAVIGNNGLPYWRRA